MAFWGRQGLEEGGYHMQRDPRKAVSPGVALGSPHALIPSTLLSNPEFGLFGGLLFRLLMGECRWCGGHAVCLCMCMENRRWRGKDRGVDGSADLVLLVGTKG
jgi:hypothetical protein